MHYPRLPRPQPRGVPRADGRPDWAGHWRPGGAGPGCPGARRARALRHGGRPRSTGGVTARRGGRPPPKLAPVGALCLVCRHALNNNKQQSRAARESCFSGTQHRRQLRSVTPLVVSPGARLLMAACILAPPHTPQVEYFGLKLDGCYFTGGCSSRLADRSALLGSACVACASQPADQPASTAATPLAHLGASALRPACEYALSWPTCATYHGTASPLRSRVHPSN